MKCFLPAVVLVFLSNIIVSAQDCKVSLENLKGTYTGDCKGNKANGKGIATGMDKYEGSFLSGLPEGDGVYTWANGNIYRGTFLKGLKNGKGSLVYRRTGLPDSVIVGYWKKDIYQGENEFPYRIYSRSKGLATVEVEYVRDTLCELKFIVSISTIGPDLLGNERVKPKVDDIQMIHGTHGILSATPDQMAKTETLINDLTFPSRMRVFIDNDDMEIEFKEKGSYIVRILINQ
jgi:hypothetical protein